MGATVTTVAGLPDLVGRELGPTRWVAVEQDAIATFARVTLDEQWIHVDRERAAQGPFGTTIAHGFFTLSLCSHFFGELLVVDDARFVVNYGLEKVRFPSPVPVGSRVRARGAVTAAAARGGAVRTVTRLTIDLEDQEKPACVADQISLFTP
jgi:acyl dehydratase